MIRARPCLLAEPLAVTEGAGSAGRGMTLNDTWMLPLAFFLVRMTTDETALWAIDGTILLLQSDAAEDVLI